MKGSLLVACALLPACSFAFVDGPTAPMIKKEVPVTCTTSRVLPAVDLLIGAALGAFVFATVYSAIEEVNDEDGGCSPGQCYTAWKPAAVGTFLVVSPWWISAAVGTSDTHQCRKAAGM